MFLDFRVKIYNFFKRNKVKIFIAIIIIAIIVGINIYLGKKQANQPPSTSYEPHTPIISGSEVKSEKTKATIDETIKNYMDKCNTKKYEDAYNMISSECKEAKFNNNIEIFKKYIDYIFDGDKIYNIQDYSNKDNIYVYKVTISEDILATGMNTEKSDITYDEMIVLDKQKDNSMKLSVAGFISKEDLNYIAEDEFMKITVEEKLTYYDKVTYKVKIKNKTSYAIVIAKDKEKDTCGISLKNSDSRAIILDQYANTEKAVRGKEEKTFELSFTKYFDEESDIQKLTFNKIRVLQEYTGIETKWEDELAKAVKTYSSTLNIK